MTMPWVMRDGVIHEEQINHTLHEGEGMWFIYWLYALLSQIIPFISSFLKHE